LIWVVFTVTLYGNKEDEKRKKKTRKKTKKKDTMMMLLSEVFGHVIYIFGTCGMISDLIGFLEYLKHMCRIR
jgi:hypothetical protein